jgi:GNAT superfamily N-acetyltransferase
MVVRHLNLKRARKEKFPSADEREMMDSLPVKICIFILEHYRAMPAISGINPDCTLKHIYSSAMARTVRKASMNDIGQCADLLELLFSQEHEFTVDRRRQLKGLELIVSRPDRGVVFVMEEEGRIIGMVVLLFTVSTALGKMVAILEDMVVAPQFRAEGVGSLLLQRACDFAVAEGLGRITLLTDHDNTAAHEFYSAKGFIKSDMVVFRKSFSS